jgi:hypothetical protein
MKENKKYEIYESYLNYSIEDMEGEIWLDLKGYEGLYKISNYGRVKSLEKKGSKKESIKRGFVQYKGYVKVQLRKENIHKNYFVHRLVLINFLHESKLEVNHKNMIKTDNRVENLEYVTGSENVQHAKKITNRIWHHTIGGNNKSAKRALAIDIDTKEIKYDVAFIKGFKDVMPEKLYSENRIRNCLRNKKIFLNCYWVYYDDYIKGDLNFDDFKKFERKVYFMKK